MNVQRAQKSSPAQLLNLLLHILIAGIAALLHGGIDDDSGVYLAIKFTYWYRIHNTNANNPKINSECHVIGNFDKYF